jgi:hypothetical protein
MLKFFTQKKSLKTKHIRKAIGIYSATCQSTTLVHNKVVSCDCLSRGSDKLVERKSDNQMQRKSKALIATATAAETADAEEHVICIERAPGGSPVVRHEPTL